MNSRKSKSPMQTPVQKRGSISSKGTGNSKHSVADRKPTPFPHGGKNKKKKMPVPEEEEDSIQEGMGSDEDMLSQSDVSFPDSDENDDIDSFDEPDIDEDDSDINEDDFGNIQDDFDESDESEMEVEAPKVEPPKKAKQTASPAVNKPKQESVPKTKAQPIVKAKQDPVVKPKQAPVVQPKQEPVVKAKQEPVVKAKQEPVVKAKQEQKTKQAEAPKKVAPAVKEVETVNKSVKRKREDNGVSAAEEYTIQNDEKRLFVTNLPANVTDDEIKGLDKNIKDFVKLAAFRKRNSSVILVFANEIAAEVSLPLLKTKKVRGGLVVADYVGHKNSRKNPHDLGPIIDTRLYVGNLGDHCSEANLKSIFTTASTISVPTMRRHTFGFAEFVDSSTAMEAIKKHNYSVFKGEKMVVQFARAKPGENKSAKLPQKAVKTVESSAKRAKVEASENSAKKPKEDSESEDKDSEVSGEDIGDVDSDEELDDSDIDEEIDDDINSQGGDDLESFDDEEED